MALRGTVKAALAGPLKRAFGALDLDVRDRRRTPAHHFLGLPSRGIRTVLDVGANIGQFAQKALAVFPDARFLCFEPLPTAYGTLATWAAGEPRVTTFNLALGEADGELTFHEHADHPTSSSALRTTAGHATLAPDTVRQRETRVPVRRLDAVLAEPGLSAGPLLLKLDVQGYEAHVLRGALDTLRRADSVITEVCLDPLYDGQATFRDLYDLCTAAGLTYAGNLDQHYGPDGHVAFFDAVFVRT